ncbi:MAG: glycerol acyltransferase [Chlorobi bacterium]|nr:glycerol acyltransferase [Chlorobiota bacterium]
MSSMYNYDDIRPYHDNEVNQKIKELLADEVFDRVLLVLYKDPAKVKQVKENLAKVQTIEQLQLGFMHSMVKMIIDSTTDGVTCSGFEHLDKSRPYLFISNHRDIILDSALLNFLILENGMNTTQIAIGDNLFVYEWIEHAVKLNRAFVVKRNIAARELLEASQKLSQYIRSSITENNISVWIAQREGRTKDGFDQTQVSLLKMLNMSNNSDYIKGFSELNIVPVSISYEIEPCGISKVNETIQRELKGFQKTSKDDFKSMAMGVLYPKGRVHFSFGRPIHSELSGFGTVGRPNEFFQNLAELIDEKIYSQFKLWANNYIAYDLLHRTNKYKKHYTFEEKLNYEKLLHAAISNVNSDPALVRERFLSLYANPVTNARSMVKSFV